MDVRLFDGGRRVDAISPLDRGLAYGDGLFETMRAHRGDVPWWDRHWSRLRQGATVLGLALPDEARARAELAGLLDGRTLHPDTELWVMTPRALRSVADRSGFTRAITRAGGRVLTDSCPAMSRAAPPGTRVFATDSAKQAHYLPAILGIEAWFGTLGECIDAAVTGRWHGGLAA